MYFLYLTHVIRDEYDSYPEHGVGDLSEAREMLLSYC